MERMATWGAFVIMSATGTGGPNTGGPNGLRSSLARHVPHPAGGQ
jgi:hypothetical protein